MSEKDIIQSIYDNVLEVKGDVAELKADVTEVKGDIVEVKSDVSELKADMTEVKSEVSELKADMTEVKSDVSELKADMAEVKSDIVVLKSDVTELKAGQRNLTDRMDKVELNLSTIRIILDEDIREELKNIAEGYRDLSRKLDEVLKMKKENENMMINMNYLNAEVKKLKRIYDNPFFFGRVTVQDR